MTPAARIALNTTVTYLRSIIAIGLTLFASRWVLQALGTTDFGLFSVVGSLIVFLTFLNAVMASSSARFFAHAIGKGDPDDVNHWFNTSLVMHLVLPTVLIVSAWPLAEFAIRNWLTIPLDRIDACIGVFRLSVIGAFVNMLSVPFVAMFNAKQRILELSLWDMLQVWMMFCLALVVSHISTDQLLFYAAGMVGINILIDSAKVARALVLFRECRIKLHVASFKERTKALVRFAAWNLFGGVAQTLSKQGSTILLNLYHGPVLNAAFGIAHQVANQANQLALALQAAIAPEIITSEGRGNEQRVMMLAHFSSKIGCVMVMLIGIPLIAEMEYVLRLWLIDPPPQTAAFCRWIIAAFLIERLTTGYMMAISARGKIAAYQASVGGILLLTLPFAWLLFAMGYPPTTLGLVILLTAAAAALTRVLWLRRLFGAPVTNWCKLVLMPCSAIATIGTLASYAPRFTMDESWARLALVALLGPASIATGAWLVGLNRPEKQFFTKSLRNGIARAGLILCSGRKKRSS